ncbi:MAG TPA: hypothetical protein VMQ17_14115 [Candidatus Sulfotelmatobacter sp.]|nr:hypothetical protein [Candidatus Sulfotelmatobacter sp.]
MPIPKEDGHRSHTSPIREFRSSASVSRPVNPLRGVAVMWQILNALTNTELEVEHRSAGMSFHIL